MTKEEIAQWFADFDRTKDTFRWFWDQYYPGQWDILLRLREQDAFNEMMGLMNSVWFGLPDNRFNIANMPSGWHEFLNLIEL